MKKALVAGVYNTVLLLPLLIQPFYANFQCNPHFELFSFCFLPLCDCIMVCMRFHSLAVTAAGILSMPRSPVTLLTHRCSTCPLQPRNHIMATAGAVGWRARVHSNAPLRKRIASGVRCTERLSKGARAQAPHTAPAVPLFAGGSQCPQTAAQAAAAAKTKATDSKCKKCCSRPNFRATAAHVQQR